MEIKIGILLPRSDMYPTLALDFLNGLKLSFNEKNDTQLIPKYIVESIGNASDDNVIKTAEKLLLEEDINLAISYCGSTILEPLVKLFEGYKKPLIHVDLGGNILTKKHISPFVVHHSLNLCESAYASGEYAINTFGKKGAIMSSIYDGGYQITGSFDKAFIKHGGSYCFQYVSGMDYKSESLDHIISGIEIEKPDFIFGVFSFKEGNRLLEALGNASFNGEIPIITTPIMTDETVVTTNYGIKNLHSIASWSFDDQRSDMKEFVSQYHKNYEKRPNVHSLLGYECGLITCLNASKNNSKSKIGEFLASESLNTPRGNISYDHYFHSKPEHLKVREFQFNSTHYYNIVRETLDASITENLNEKFENQLLTGWHNPYTCT